jgi:hypothetical protein
VATDQPSPEQPQWITLELFGSQEVSAVAVFGEAINNDGIQDAQVQVAGSKPGEFTTVATVEGATSASWLATFEPVKTTAVRLLVTRSGGPSTHTDVYEIEVFGRILPAAELKPQRHEELAASRQAARRAATGVNVISAREGTKLRLTNDRVSVVLDEAEGSWDATWLGGMDATVRRVRFGVEVDRQNLTSQPAKADAVPFKDPIGSGLEVRQRWGTRVEVQRRIRLYHGLTAVAVSAQVTNGADQGLTEAFQGCDGAGRFLISDFGLIPRRLAISTSC